MPETIQSHCNTCAGERSHHMLHREVYKWSNEVADVVCIEGTVKYEMLRCCGCSTFSLRQTSDDSESPPGEVNICYYPPRSFRPLPRWLSQLDPFLPGERTVQELLEEVYVALQNDLRRLATMGIRAILEHVMIDKVGDHGTFGRNLNAFEEKGFVSKSQRAILVSVLEAGHATIHRAFSPSPDELVALIDITENVIESIYLNELRVAKVAGKVPPRGAKRQEPRA